MDVEVTLKGPGVGDDLRSLREWLLDEDELRGRVKLREAPPTRGTMGPVPDALLVAVAGAASSRFATVLVTWLRTRVSDVTVTVTPGPDGPAIDLNAANIRGLDAEGLRCQIAELLQGVSGPAPTSDSEPAGGNPPPGASEAPN